MLPTLSFAFHVGTTRRSERIAVSVCLVEVAALAGACVAVVVFCVNVGPSADES